MSFAGADYEPELDESRLTHQIARVLAAISDGAWHTLSALAEMTGAPEASVSAQLRNLRKAQHGRHTIHRRRCGDPRTGLFEYALVISPARHNAITQGDSHMKLVEFAAGFTTTEAKPMIRVQLSGTQEELDAFIRTHVAPLLFGSTTPAHAAAPASAPAAPAKPAPQVTTPPPPAAPPAPAAKPKAAKAPPAPTPPPPVAEPEADADDAGEAEGEAGEIPAAILAADKMRTVLTLLVEAGLDTRKDIVEWCVENAVKVPVLAALMPNVQERITRAAALLPLKDA